MSVDLILLYRKATNASSALGSILEISRLQNYGRLDAETASSAISLIARDEESAKTLFAAVDAVVAGVAELKTEVVSRRAAALVK
jgi:hypothetical protein